jgi:hypothetical protein
MVGASRCIVATLFKFGGPEPLPQAAPSLCVPTRDSSLLDLVRMTSNGRIFTVSIAIHSTKNLFRAKNEKGFLRLRDVGQGLRAHVQGREATALFAAAA